MHKYEKYIIKITITVKTNRIATEIAPTKITKANTLALSFSPASVFQLKDEKTINCTYSLIKVKLRVIFVEQLSRA